MGSSAKKFGIACKTRMGNAMEVSKQLYVTIKNILRQIFKGGQWGQIILTDHTESNDRNQPALVMIMQSNSLAILKKWILQI